MSVICRTFVQNAWRSDLCSNCFKSLEDHSDSTRRNNVCTMPRYVPQAASLYQSRGISTSLKWRLNESLYDRVSRRDIASQTAHSKVMSQPGSILIKNDSTDKKFRSVDFADEEALVIGYGGNDYDSDTSPWEIGSDDGSIDFDLLDDTDEDRKITRLTRNNTEFNSFNKNLLSGEDSTLRIKREEEKLNSINNNVNTPVKTTDKTISILTYNDIQSTKKLHQYFFPSSTEIKSYLNGYGVSEENGVKNNNEKSQLTSSAKVQNCKREAEKNTNSKIALDDDFTPLNTRTYSFVSELNRNNVSFEQSSDSDYSTCRHTAGDSTDSESFHDVEERRPLPKSSFLHGTYALSPPQMNESDTDKKYDAGSSTSGDVSNFSDDSDTHESADRTLFKPRIQPVTDSKIHRKDGEHEAQQNRKNEENARQLCHKDEKDVALYGKAEERSAQLNRKNEGNCVQPLHKNKDRDVQLYRKEDVQFRGKEEDPDFQQQTQKESPKSESKQCATRNSPKDKRSPPTSKHNSPTPVSNKQKMQGEDVRKVGSQETQRKSPISDTTIISLKNNTPKPEEMLRVVSKSASMPDMKTPSVVQVNGSPISKNKEPEHETRVCRAPISDTKNPISPSNLQVTTFREESEVSGNNLVQNDDNIKEQILRDKEFKDYENHSDYEKSPDAIVDRQSKLAALALELELARRDSEAKNNKLASSLPSPIPPPEVKVRYSLPNVPIDSAEIYPTIKKASAISCASRLTTLPDVLQETPTKQKKTKFSLKKLLKRNKDSGTFSPANKEVNPKAWKKQTFDRNRLSLEIVHPMDLTSDVPTSADSTPTEEHKPIVSTHPGKFMFKGVSSRARSLSALPQLSGDEQSGCALLDCRKMDTVPMRKAGTVAERKKNRPSLVRTPSCSALPNRSTTATTTLQSSDRAPPPKPPPPPKYKAMHPPPPPPPPHSHPRVSKPITNSPARPPPPKVPETKSRSHSSGSSAQELDEQNHSDKEYANLGDIRSLMTPKKPQRPSAFSAPPRDGEMEAARKGGTEDIYETLPATTEEEEDHYTYLDEAEVRVPKVPQVKSTETKAVGETMPCGRPWLDLQTSYAAIAAANYESLAELITTSLNEGAEYFKRMEHSLKWRDFILDSEQQFHAIKEKAVYNATCRNEQQDKVTLVVAPRKPTTPQNARNQTRYPVLANFNDHVPKSLVSTDNYILQDSEMASVYILQQSKVTTVGDFALASGADVANQYIHLRNYCFVLLQLIHTLKSLQAEGIEEINYDLQILTMVVTDEDKPPILVLFPEDKLHLTLCDSFNRKTLCQATLQTMLHFLQIRSVEDLKTCVVNGEHLADPVAHTFRAIAKVLSEEKASSLSQAKGFLEYMLWGPVDVKTDSEDILQRWLDLQRAQMVKSTISQLQNSRLDVYEEYQLIFLLQASVKSLKNVVSKL